MINTERAILNIRNSLENYITSNGVKSLVIGISGGLNSAVCAALAKPVCEKLGIELIGLSIPICHQTPSEITSAREVGSSYCTKFIEIPMHDEAYDFEEESSQYISFADKDQKFWSAALRTDRTTSGNSIARVRMRWLYHVAKNTGGIVIDTTCLTDYLLGFTTLHGDTGDIAPIRNLWRVEEVTLIANALVIPNYIVYAEATDGLGISKTDLDQLGVKDYRQIEEKLQEFLKLEVAFASKIAEREALSSKSNDEDFSIILQNINDEITDLFEKRMKFLSNKIIERYHRNYFKRNTPYVFDRGMIAIREGADSTKRALAIEAKDPRTNLHPFYRNGETITI